MQFQTEKEKVVIVDFVSQVTKLIARRIREQGVYSEIITPNSTSKIKQYNNIKGIKMLKYSLKLLFKYLNWDEIISLVCINNFIINHLIFHENVV